VIIALAQPQSIDFSNCEAFQSGFFALLDAQDRHVIFDASAVQFFDSAGLGALLPIRNALRERKGELSIAGLGRPLLEVFRMVGFDAMFRIHEDADQAAAAVAEGAGGTT